MWKLLSTSDEVELYSILSSLYQKAQEMSPSVFYVQTSSTKLLSILKEDHGPQIYILTVALLSHLCQTQGISTRSHLVKGNVIRYLMELVGIANRPSKNSEEKTMLELLRIVTNLLAYLAIGPKECHEHLLFENAIKTMFQVLDYGNEITFKHTAGGKDYLSNIALGKHLIAPTGQLLSPEEVKDKCTCLSGIHVSNTGVVLGELWNTSDGVDGDVNIVDCMVEGKVAWPAVGAAKQEGNSHWQDIYVTSIIDSSHMWAHVGTDEDLQMPDQIIDALESYPLRDRLYLKYSPKSGEFISSRKNGGELFRAIVISVTNETEIYVFAIDYGFTCTVLLKDSFYITKDMNLTHPPQAKLCELRGNITYSVHASPILY